MPVPSKRLLSVACEDLIAYSLTMLEQGGKITGSQVAGHFKLVEAGVGMYKQVFDHSMLTDLPTNFLEF